MKKPKKPLSKRAQGVLARIYAGEFYYWTPNPTGALKELIDAGLLWDGGRVVSIKRCYVPPGTKPFKVETIPPRPAWLPEFVHPIDRPK